MECSTSETQACGSSYGNTRGYAGGGVDLWSYANGDPINFLLIGRLARIPNLLRAIPGTHPLGLLRSESPPPGFDFWDPWGLAAAAIRAGWGASRIYASTEAADQSGVLDFAEGEALGIASGPTNPWGAYQTMQGYGAFAGWVVVELGNAWDSGEK